MLLDKQEYHYFTFFRILLIVLHRYLFAALVGTLNLILFYVDENLAHPDPNNATPTYNISIYLFAWIHLPITYAVLSLFACTHTVILNR